MVGARARVNGDILLVGAGTALTIDLIDAAGTHHGGLIAPSPGLMIEAIERRTARVRVDRDPVRTDFAADTAAALYSGAWNAAIALIERASVRAAARLGRGAPALLLHGGDAAALDQDLSAAQVAPALVLEGLARHVSASTRT
jgi:type III pantothenate kinase